MENPVFIGSIIDVLVGIINISGGFYRNFNKINQNYHTGVKITKLGRENSSNYIVQWVYAILRVKIHIVKIHIVKKLTLKHFNVKSYYFCILHKY